MATGTESPSDRDRNPDKASEGPLEQVEDAVREAAGEAETAAWETVYEVKGLAEEAVEKISGNGGSSTDD